MAMQAKGDPEGVGGNGTTEGLQLPKFAHKMQCKCTYKIHCANSVHPQNTQ